MAYTTQEIADILGVPLWKVQRVFEQGDLAEPPRFAGKRAVPKDMLSDVVDALRARGWLPVREEVSAS